MLTASQVMQVCKFDLAHSYVNVRHKLFKRGLGAPMGGMLSAFYAIICCSKLEAAAFTPRLRDLSMPVSVCRYMDDVHIVIAYVTDDQLTQATEVVRYIAAVGTGYPPPLVLNLEPEGPQRFLDMYIQCVGTSIITDLVLQQGGRRLDKVGKHSAGSASFNIQHGISCNTAS